MFVRKVFTEEYRERAIELRKGGLSFRSIARLLGVSHSTVQYHLPKIPISASVSMAHQKANYRARHLDTPEPQGPPRDRNRPNAPRHRDFIILNPDEPEPWVPTPPPINAHHLAVHLYKLAREGKYQPPSPETRKLFSARFFTFLEFEASGHPYTNHQRGHIAEEAVAFMLSVEQMTGYLSRRDGDEVDLVIRTSTGRPIQVAVRWVGLDSGRTQTAPFFRVTRVYRGAERKAVRRVLDYQLYDALVAYYMPTDTCYMIPVEIASQYKREITLRKEWANDWELLRKASQSIVRLPSGTSTVGGSAGRGRAVHAASRRGPR